MEKEMVQQIMRAPHQVGFRKVPVPAVLPGQVKVRIQMIGICGSDILNKLFDFGRIKAPKVCLDCLKYSGIMQIP